MSRKERETKFRKIKDNFLWPSSFLNSAPSFFLVDTRLRVSKSLKTEKGTELGRGLRFEYKRIIKLRSYCV